MKIYLVGGAVRDKLLNLPIKERDWVVVNSTVAEMLQKGFRQVGKEFPVFLHPETQEEYALARIERKTKPGYQGFAFDVSQSVTLEDDLKRRDLTINAMAETLESALIDPYNGKRDLEQKILRHVSPAFSEDPVRILRVGRFLARYASKGFNVAPETYALMQVMVANNEVNALVAERVWKELERALSELNPEKFFEVLYYANALSILFPHLTIDGPGIKALQAASQLTTDTAIRFAALLHAMPEDAKDKSQQREVINGLCHRYRVPNYFKELAQLSAKFNLDILRQKKLSGDELLYLFHKTDVFRREDRFRDMLIACQAIATSHGKTLDLDWFLAALKAAKSVDVQALIKQGYAGVELAGQLLLQRKSALEQWLNK